MTTIVLESFRHELPGRLPPAIRQALAANPQALGQSLVSGQGQTGPLGLAGLPPQVAHQALTAVHESLAIGIQRAFLLGGLLLTIGLVTSFFLPEIALRRTVRDETSQPPATPTPSGARL